MVTFGDCSRKMRRYKKRLTRTQRYSLPSLAKVSRCVAILRVARSMAIRKRSATSTDQAAYQSRAERYSFVQAVADALALRLELVEI